MSTDETKKEIGRRIKGAREAKRWKLREVCEQVPGLEISRLGNYESGAREPDVDMIKRLAAVLGVPAAYLMTLDEPANGEFFTEKELGICENSLLLTVYDLMEQEDRDATDEFIRGVLSMKSGKSVRQRAKTDRVFVKSLKQFRRNDQDEDREKRRPKKEKDEKR